MVVELVRVEGVMAAVVVVVMEEVGDLSEVEPVESGCGDAASKISYFHSRSKMGAPPRRRAGISPRIRWCTHEKKEEEGRRGGQIQLKYLLIKQVERWDYFLFIGSVTWPSVGWFVGQSGMIS